MHEGLPFSKPKVRLRGDPGAAQAYLGEAYNLLFQVRSFCEASGAPVFAMSRPMEDGALVTAAVVGDEHIVSCTPPPLTTEPEKVPEEPAPGALYLDYGWLRRMKPGYADRAGDGHFALSRTDKSRATYDKVIERFEGAFLKLGDEARFGDSFGINESYDDLTEAEAAARKLKDARKLAEKQNALLFPGGVTGLMRCAVRGFLARRLHETPNLSYSRDTDICVAFDRFLLAKNTGILLGAEQFVLVEFGNGSFRCRPIELKAELQGFYEQIGSIGGREEKAAFCTFLLAFSKLSHPDEWYSIDFGESPGMPIAGGFNFSMFSNRCVCTSYFMLPSEEGGGAKFSRFEYTFRERGEPGKRRFFAVKERHDTYYGVTGRPALWVPVPSLGFIMKFLPAPRPVDQEIAEVYAFYDWDELKIVGLKNDEYKSSADFVSRSVETVLSCIAGKSYERRIDVSGRTVTAQIQESGSTVYNTEDMESYTERYEEGVSDKGVVNFDQTTTAPAANACYIQSFAENAPYNMRQHPFLATHNAYQKLMLGSKGAGLACVLPYSYYDSVFYTKMLRSDATGTHDAFTRTNYLRGLFVVHRTEGYPIVEWVAPVSFRVPAVSGGLHNSELTYTIPNDTPLYMFEKEGRASVTACGRHNVYHDNYRYEGEGELPPGTDTTTAVDVFTGSEPYLYFMPFVVFSMHGEGYAFVRGEIPVHSFGGTPYIGGVPIGIQ